MIKLKQILLIYMLRLPFFLVVYSLFLLINQDDSISFLLYLLGVYALICLLDMQLARKGVFLILCLVICVFLMLFRLPQLAVITVCAALYRPVSYTGSASMIWVACLLILTFLFEFAQPSLSYICARNVLLAAVFTILARQIQELDWFLGSHYSSQVSRKTASSIIKRSYRLTLTGLAVIIVVGFFVTRPVNSESGVRDSVADTIGDFADFIHPQPSDPPPEEADPTAIPDDIESVQEFSDLDNLAFLMRDIAFVIMYILTALLSLGLVFFLLYSLHRREANRFDDFDEVLEEEPAAPGPRAGKRRGLVILGPNQTVRKLFKSRVRKHMELNGLYPKKSDTPKKLAAVISEWEDIEALHLLYSKARYSGQNVTRSELNALYTQRGYAQRRNRG